MIKYLLAALLMSLPAAAQVVDCSTTSTSLHTVSINLYPQEDGSWHAILRLDGNLMQSAAYVGSSVITGTVSIADSLDFGLSYCDRLPGPVPFTASSSTPWSYAYPLTAAPTYRKFSVPTTPVARGGGDLGMTLRLAKP